MTEQDVLKDYRRNVARAERESKTELVRKIKAIKQDRNRALKLIRKEQEVNARQKQTLETVQRDETGGGPDKNGPEQESGPFSGLESGQGPGQEETPDQEPKAP
ncbi:unnamed protein product [marine sediment metagenome]|uniref:Uncharacterized protein n=1 Tax=marine sediment metagenome TaxID=412755 RepID=X1VZ37_9ZZZZ